MKNVFIIGVPRSGKTSLAEMIKKEFPIYNSISYEAVRNGFINSQPELRMNCRDSLARQTILPQFMMEFAIWNKNFCKNPCLIEGSFASVKFISQYKNDNIIICLGHGNMEFDTIVKNIFKYSKKEDYTNEWTIEKISLHFHDISLMDKENMDQCKINGIKYYDTTNRTESLEKIIEDLKFIFNA